MIRISRRRYLDILRVLCAFCVVMLHSNEGIWVFSRERYWVEATTIFFFLYFAAPCFFMISGACLIDYSDRYSTRTFIRKRIVKTLIPYIAWNLIGIAYLVFRKAMSIDQLNIRVVFQMLIQNDVIPPYWFFNAIFMLYLFTPVLSFIPENKRKTVYSYIMISIFVLNVLAPFFLQILGAGTPQIQMPIATVCLYYIAGFYLDRYPISNKARIIIYLLGVIGLSFLLFGTIIASIRANGLAQNYMGYNNLPCVLFTIALFCAFKQLSAHAVKTKDLLKKMEEFSKWGGVSAKETFGIYLVHWYVLNEIKFYFSLNYSDFMYRIPGGIAAFFISYLIVKILRTIPGVKHIIP